MHGVNGHPDDDVLGRDLPAERVDQRVGSRAGTSATTAAAATGPTTGPAREGAPGLLGPVGVQRARRDEPHGDGAAGGVEDLDQQVEPGGVTGEDPGDGVGLEVLGGRRDVPGIAVGGGVVKAIREVRVGRHDQRGRRRGPAPELDRRVPHAVEVVGVARGPEEEVEHEPGVPRILPGALDVEVANVRGTSKRPGVVGAAIPRPVGRARLAVVADGGHRPRREAAH